MFKMLSRVKAFFLCDKILKNFKLLENTQNFWPNICLTSLQTSSL